MDKKRLLQLAGVSSKVVNLPFKEGTPERVVLNEEEIEGERIAAADDEMMKELRPLKIKLDAIMKKYPHASYQDVADWLID